MADSKKIQKEEVNEDLKAEDNKKKSKKEQNYKEELKKKEEEFNKKIELTKEQEESITKLVNDNYKTIAEFNKQKEKLSLAENNAKEIQTKFDDFKKSYDGVDVEELKNKINTLTNDIDTQKTNYETQISKMNLDSVLSAKAKEYGCKDFDLAKSQINYDELLKSKDQTND